MDRLLVLGHPLIADSSIVQVLEVLRVVLQRFSVIGYGLIVESYSDVAVSSGRITSRIITRKFYLLCEIVNGYLVFLKASVEQSYIRESLRILRVDLNCLQKVLDRFFVLPHVFKAASSVVVRDCIFIV